MDFLPIIGWIVAPVMAAVIGYLTNSINYHRKLDLERDKKRDAEHQMLVLGMRELLKSQLYIMHHRHVVLGEPMTYSDKERADSIYKTYQGLDGNGAGTNIYNELVKAYIK